MVGGLGGFVKVGWGGFGHAPHPRELFTSWVELVGLVYS